MTYTLRYTPKFVSDFELIHADVQQASGSVAIADRYLRDFARKIKSKQLFPESAKKLFVEDAFTGYYFVHFKAYNAFYLIKDGYIELTRALPSKSDYVRVLLGDYYEEDLDSFNEAEYLNETTTEQR